MFLVTTSYGQSTAKPSFIIPENEYLIAKMINELENERKQLSLDIKYLERLAVIVKDNSTILNNYKPIKIDTRETLIEANSKLKLKYIDRNEFANVSDFDVKDIANEVLKTSYIGFGTLELDDFSSGAKINYNEVSESLKNSIESMKLSFSNAGSRIENTKQLISKKIEEIDGKLSGLYNHKSQSTDLHRISIIIGLPAFCVTILLLFLIPYYLERKSTTDNPAANNKQYLLDIATVLLLTLTILILGLAKMITSEVLGTLLGGISAYVLNRTTSRNSTN